MGEPAHLLKIVVKKLPSATILSFSLDQEVAYSLNHRPGEKEISLIFSNTRIDIKNPYLEINSPFVEKIEVKEKSEGRTEIRIRTTERGDAYLCYFSPKSLKLILQIGPVAAGLAPARFLPPQEGIALPMPDESGRYNKAPVAAGLALPAEGEYLISPTDLLEIKVYEHPDLTQKAEVSSAGTIPFPLIERIKVIDLSATQIEAELERRLKDFIVNPHVTVLVTKHQNIYVYGEVKNPGAYELTPGLSVLEAITMAGGFTEIAYQDKTKIIRSKGDDKKTIKVKISDITRRGDKSKDIPLKIGDIIIVPESFF